MEAEETMNIFYIIFFMIGHYVHGMEKIASQEISADEKKRHADWRSSQKLSADSFETAAPHIDLSPSIERLALQKKPHPQLFSLYLRPTVGQPYKLVIDSTMPIQQKIRIFGSEETNISYITHGSPVTLHSKEGLTTPQKAPSRDRSQPTAKSSSYPEGCYTIYYATREGKIIQFQRGHIVSHKETIPHEGKISTKDPENYVAQHAKYNSPLRRDLVELRYHGTAYTYKEISVYHLDCLYNVTITDKKAPKPKVRVPVPEGFVLIIFKLNDDIETMYYFPNFIDYDEVKRNLSVTHQPWYAPYEITALSDWFVIPHVSLDDIPGQKAQITIAEKVRRAIVEKAPSLFSTLHESQMPQKARMALLLLLLEWNMQAAASLEFLTVKHKLNLVDFYTSHRSLYELDSRPHDERITSINDFIADPQFSKPAKDLVRFLKNNFVNFADLQKHLYAVMVDADSFMRYVPARCELADLAPHMYTIKTDHTKHAINLLALPQADIKGFQSIIGGLNTFDPEKALQVLTVIEDRLHATTEISVKDSIRLVNFYSHDPLFHDVQKKGYWESKLKESKTKPRLKELRKILDYYALHEVHEARKYWIGEFTRAIQANPDLDSFNNVARWCFKEKPAFLYSMEEYKDTLSAAHLLAFQILKGLEYVLPDTYNTADCLKILISKLQQPRFGYTHFVGPYAMTSETDTYSSKLPLDMLLEKEMIRPCDLTLRAFQSNGLPEMLDLFEAVSSLFYDRIQQEYCSQLTLKASSNAQAAVELGRRFRIGLGVPQSDQAALTHFRSPICNEHTDALYEIGMLFHEGKAVPKQSEKIAYEYFLKSAKAHHPRALLFLGILHAEKLIENSTPLEAKQWYRKAAEQGEKDAMALLGAALIKEVEAQPANKKVKIMQAAARWILLSLIPKEEKKSRNTLNAIIQNFGFGTIENIEIEERNSLAKAGRALLKNTKLNSFANRALTMLLESGLSELATEAAELVIKTIKYFPDAMNTCSVLTVHHKAHCERAIKKAIELAQDTLECLALINVIAQNDREAVIEKCFSLIKNSLDASHCADHFHTLRLNTAQVRGAEASLLLAHTAQHFSEAIIGFIRLKSYEKAIFAARNAFNLANTCKDYRNVATRCTDKSVKDIGLEATKRCHAMAKTADDLWMATQSWYSMGELEKAKFTTQKAVQHCKTQEDISFGLSPLTQIKNEGISLFDEELKELEALQKTFLDQK